jgi:hypothetical protein
VMIQFLGEVRCLAGGGAVNLQLHGRSQCPGASATLCETDIMFAGANPSGLPASLHEVSVSALDYPGGVRRIRIESAEGRWELLARSAQLHRAAGAAMFAAVPSRRVPWPLRAGWSLLLSLLAIPGAARLLLRRRGSA